MGEKAARLDVSFDAEIQKSTARGGWTYVIWPQSAAFFRTRGLIKVRGLIDRTPFESAFMALGGGAHKLPVRAEILKRIGKPQGDRIVVRLTERLS